MNTLIINVTESSYTQEVVESDRPVLIDFWAPWCGPCKALIPTLDSLATVYADQVKIVKVNADENKSLVERFGVRTLPSLIMVRGEKTLGNLSGRTRTHMAREIDSMLE